MSQTPASAPKEKGRVTAALSGALHILLQNWKTKLLALLIAIALWAGLIAQDPTLTREKRFSDVAVTISGAETLKRNGYIVTSDLESLLDDVTLEVDVPQMQYTAAQASNYNVRVDLSRIKQTGEQEVRILGSNSAAYGTVTSVEPDTVRIMVDEYVTRYRIPVSVVTSNSVPEGFYATTAAVDPPMLTISGPASLVNDIALAEVRIDLSELPQREGAWRRAVSYTLLDENDKAVSSDLLQITSESVLVDSIVVSQTVYTKRELAMSDIGLVRGTPVEGYEVKSAYVTPSVITVAGSKELLDTIELLYPHSYVDASGMSGSFNQTLQLRRPANLQYISATEVTVTVEVGPIMGTQTYDEVPLDIHGLRDGLRATTDHITASVRVTGPQLSLDLLEKSWLEMYVDLTELEAGEYDLPLVGGVKDDESGMYTVEATPDMVHVVIEPDV